MRQPGGRTLRPSSGTQFVRRRRHMETLRPAPDLVSGLRGSCTCQTRNAGDSTTRNHSCPGSRAHVAHCAQRTLRNTFPRRLRNHPAPAFSEAPDAHREHGAGAALGGTRLTPAAPRSLQSAPSARETQTSAQRSRPLCSATLPRLVSVSQRSGAKRPSGRRGRPGQASALTWSRLTLTIQLQHDKQ